MKKALTKLIILITVATILMQSIVPISYADEAQETGGDAGWLVREQQEAVALFTQRFIVEGHEKNLLIYSQNRYDRIKGYNLEVTSNEYGQYDGRQNNGAPFTNMLVYDSASFVATMYNRTLGMELSANKNARDNIYTVKSFAEDAKAYDNFAFPFGEKIYSSEELIGLADAGQLIPGDLIYYEDETHIMMYLGTNEDIYYDELRMTEAEVEIQLESGMASGQTEIISLPNPHYFAHAANTSDNITVSALELLPYRDRLELLPFMDYYNAGFYVIRPIMTTENGITSEDKIDMDIRWPSSSYSAYTKLGIDPVSGQENEYYYIGIPNTQEYSYDYEYEYQAIQSGTGGNYSYTGSSNYDDYNLQKSYNPLDWIVDGVDALISYFTGMVSMFWRAFFAGWTSIVEWLVSDTVQMTGEVQRETTQTVEGNEYAITDASILNIEDIVYNRVPLFDANIFNTSSVAGVPIVERKSTEEINDLKERARAGDAQAKEELEDYYHSVTRTMPELEFTEIEDLILSGDEEATALLEEYRDQENIILVIRKGVANVYYAIRNIAIIGLLITLIYIGIRMAISSIAEQKAKYKGMLINWCVSLVIVFVIHYVMIFILQINESLINMLPEINNGVSFYETFRLMAYGDNLMEGWIGTIVYMVLVFTMVKYVWIYIKRFLTLCVLTMAAPIVGIGYAVDKIKDNKSQSLSRWVKNYVFTVIIQFIHAALYTILMSIVYSIMARGSEEAIWGAAILTFIFLNFMPKAVDIVKQIFRVNDARTLKNTLEDFGTQMTGLMSIIGLTKLQRKLYSRALRPLKVGAEKAVDELRYEHYKPIDLSSFDHIANEEERMKAIREEVRMREKLEADRERKIKEDRANRKKHFDAQMQYAKNMASVGKSMLMTAAAIPSVVISPKAGMAMLLTAKNTYGEAMRQNRKLQTQILGYDIDKFQGRFSMARVIVGTATMGLVEGKVAQSRKTQRQLEKMQDKAIQSRTNLINLEIAMVNEVNDQMADLRQKERKLREELTDQIFEKILDSQIDVNIITDPELKRMLQKFLNGERGLAEQLAVKEKLDEYIRKNAIDGKIKSQIEIELEIMRKILRRLTDGKERIEAQIEDGKIKIAIPREIIRQAIARYSEERERKQLPVNIGGAHMSEILQYIAEYADTKISQQRKVEEMELYIEAGFLKEVLNEIRGSSYREGEENRNSRYRDPRKASSLLEANQIEEKEVDQYVQRRIDIDTVERVAKDDISKMAEAIFQEANIQDEQRLQQKQEILEAIEGKIEEKVESMQREKKIASLLDNEYVKDQNMELSLTISEAKKQEMKEAIEQAIQEDTKEAGRVLRDRLDILLPRDEIRSAMENLQVKDLITVIAGSGTEVTIPDHLLDLERSVHNLQEARRELQAAQPNARYRDINVNDLVKEIRKKK